MKIVFHDQAKTDLDKAAAFYEQQEKGLGREVYSFLAKQIEQLPDRAGTHLFLGHCYRAVLQGRFPYYLVFYQIEGQQLRILAVLDGRRNPRRNQQLLDKRF
jgi:plasmid stabilization system protein ParE